MFTDAFNCTLTHSEHNLRLFSMGKATDFNSVKSQSRGHAKKVKCSSTSKRVPRATKADRKRSD